MQQKSKLYFKFNKIDLSVTPFWNKPLNGVNFFNTRSVRTLSMFKDLQLDSNGRFHDCLMFNYVVTFRIAIDNSIKLYNICKILPPCFNQQLLSLSRIEKWKQNKNDKVKFHIWLIFLLTFFFCDEFVSNYMQICGKLFAEEGKFYINYSCWFNQLCVAFVVQESVLNLLFVSQMFKNN